MERFYEYFIPAKYELSFEFDKEKVRGKGKLKLTGEAKAETIKLHAVGLEDLRVSGERYTYKDGVLCIELGRRGAVKLEMSWEWKLNDNMEGCYVSSYRHKGKTEKIITTQFESNYARECFPCVDEPEAKAVFSIALGGVDESEVALSNMPVKSQKDGLYKFGDTPKMSTYLLAFVIGKLHSVESVNKHGVRVASWGALNQPKKSLEHANCACARFLDYYSERFGVPYPLPKMDQVALPDFEAGAMENWGLMTFREAALLADDKSSAGQRRYVALVVAHEASHQWFGDLVTMKWWDDLWLNESFATLIEYLAVDAVYPEYNIMEDFYNDVALSALRRDCLRGVQSVKCEVKDPAEIATLFDSAIVYSKGARLLLMLMREMGDDAFYAGLRDYFEKYKYSNTVAADLWSCLAPKAGFDVEGYMTTWLERSGYPVIENGKQKRFLISGVEPEEEWPVRKVRDDMSGHYLIKLSDVEFSREVDDFHQKSLEQKLRLLIDRSLLAKTPEVESNSLIPLLEKLKGETCLAVWEMVSTTISDLRVFFDDDDRDMRRWVNELVGEQYARLGIIGKGDEEERRLRGLILSLTVYGGDPKKLKRIAGLTKAVLAEMDAETRASALVASIKSDRGEEKLRQLILELEKTTDPEIRSDILSAVTATEDTEVVKLLSEPKVIRPQDHVYFYAYLRKNKALKELAFAWLRENWDFVRSLGGSQSAELYPKVTASTIRNAKEQKLFDKFFEEYAKDPAYKRTIRIGQEEIAGRLKLIESDGATVREAVAK